MESERFRLFTSPWIPRGAAIFLVLLHFALGITSAWIKSPTVDEYTYISTGYLYVKTGDFRLDRTHPPLIRLLIGLPLQFLPIEMPPWQMEKWDTPDSYFLGYPLGWEMMLGGKNDWRKILILARLPILLLSCGLAGLVYLWGRRLYGTAGGLTSLFLYVLCPNLLAHGRLATMDLGSAFFIFLALFALYTYSERPSPVRLILAGVALGGALAAKVTALMLIPVFLIALAWIKARNVDTLRQVPLLPILKNTFVLLLVVLLTLFVVYGYPIKPFYYLDTLRNVVAKSLAAGRGGETVPGMPHRNHAFYLFGNYSTEGWPYYYLAAAAVKTPLPILIGFLLCQVAGKKRWRGLPDGIMVGTLVLLQAMAAFNRVNIGLRHILPFYPLLYLYLGRVAELRGHRL
ncbi:MAG: ArnT family glycosyltransferase, partial [bacterium]